MLIPNTLRQEHMPLMVYSLCKLAEDQALNRDEMQKYMTASFVKTYKEKSENQFNLVFAFAKAAGFIDENQRGVTCNFSKEELSSFSTFTYAVLTKIYLEENKFNTILKWYLQQDMSVESDFTGTARSFRERALEDQQVRKYGIEEDDIHGFFFWVEAFNIAMFEKYRSGHMLFCIENLLLQYLKRHSELVAMGSISIMDFFEKVQEDIYFIPYCYDNLTNRIYYPMAQALRILDNMGMIRLEYVKDSARSWHMPKSAIFTKTNMITNIRVMKV